MFYVTYTYLFIYLSIYYKIVHEVQDRQRNGQSTCVAYSLCLSGIIIFVINVIVLVLIYPAFNIYFLRLQLFEYFCYVFCLYQVILCIMHNAICSSGKDSIYNVIMSSIRALYFYRFCI